MKTALGTFAALLFAGSLCTQPANAQPAPQGSYLNSCTHIGMDRDRLIADCRREDGHWQRTVLDIDRCVGDIANINGHLSCNRGVREGYGSSSEDRGLWEHRARCWHIMDPAERERCWWGR
jgi:CVNH domain